MVIIKLFFQILWMKVECAIFSNYFIHFFKSHKNKTPFYIAVIRLCNMSTSV